MIKEKMQKANDRLNLLEALKQLLADLNKLGPVPNNIERKEIYNPWVGENRVHSVPRDLSLYDYAVRFFDIIAKFQDKKLLKPGLLSDAKSIDELIDHVEKSGRHEYGWVRSKPGEQVTENNVYLGDVFGIWTFTINEFKKSFANTNNSTRDFTQWAIQIYQLQSFLNSHIEPMKRLINSALSNEAKARHNVIDSLFNKIAERKH